MKTSTIVASFVTWLFLTVAGTMLLVDYGSRPGRAAEAPETWPAASSLTHATDRPTLVMFVHPQCSCSRASLNELERIIAQTGGARALRMTVVFFEAEERGQDWVESRLWERATALPGVEVVSDPGGRQIELFGAFTSGQTLLYDREGALLFRGGITGARAHEGDNAGRSAVVALVRDRLSVAQRTFVFGCSIKDRVRTAFSLR